MFVATRRSPGRTDTFGPTAASAAAGGRIPNCSWRTSVATFPAEGNSRPPLEHGLPAGLRLALVGLVLVAPAPAQQRLTGKQLAQLALSSIEVGHPDRQVAGFLKNVILTERLDDRTIESLQGRRADWILPEQASGVRRKNIAICRKEIRSLWRHSTRMLRLRRSIWGG